MDRSRIEELLAQVKRGECSVEEAADRLRRLPFEDLGFARIDHHRALRQGFPEVIYAAGKTSDQVVGIAQKMVAAGSNVLITRVSGRQATEVMGRLNGAEHHPVARIITIKVGPLEVPSRGTVAVLCAGTSDLPVAEEARVTLEMMGQPVESRYDVGVSGLHRLFHEQELLETATVFVVVAGMEGALPSVVGGLVDRPVIAVPTSEGYGASFGGLAALLAMLNSCAAGVSVVNIDNGFGAGYVAGLINRA